MSWFSDIPPEEKERMARQMGQWHPTPAELAEMGRLMQNTWVDPRRPKRSIQVEGQATYSELDDLTK